MVFFLINVKRMLFVKCISFLALPCICSCFLKCKEYVKLLHVQNIGDLMLNSDFIMVE